MEYLPIILLLIAIFLCLIPLFKRKPKPTPKKPRVSEYDSEGYNRQGYNEVGRKYKKLIGKSGKAITKIDLAGKAKIKGQIYDVMSMNSYIEAGQHVKVVEIRDNTIMVRKWFE